MYSKDQIEKAVKSKGYKWFEGPKDYDVNIVGVRTSSTGKSVSNKIIILQYNAHPYLFKQGVGWYVLLV